MGLFIYSHLLLVKMDPASASSMVFRWNSDVYKSFSHVFKYVQLFLKSSCLFITYSRFCGMACVTTFEQFIRILCSLCTHIHCLQGVLDHRSTLMISFIKISLIRWFVLETPGVLNMNVTIRNVVNALVTAKRHMDWVLS